jgi:SagB-type dehydrogenase family enzyme
MKTIFLLLFIGNIFSHAFAQDNIRLLPPDTERGLPVMKALSLRSSAVDYDTSKLDLRDLSDLLWAANGVNRPESGKRTAPSAINAQDIDIYILMETGVYLYNASSHLLQYLSGEDHRNAAAGSQPNAAKAPVICVIVSDISKFSRGTDSLKMVWAAEDAGIVSQNISLFCASVELSTRPRASMDHQKLRAILNLKDTQYLLLNHPVSYKK